MITDKARKRRICYRECSQAVRGADFDLRCKGHQRTRVIFGAKSGKHENPCTKQQLPSPHCVEFLATIFLPYRPKKKKVSCKNKLNNCKTKILLYCDTQVFPSKMTGSQPDHPEMKTLSQPVLHVDTKLLSGFLFSHSYV